MNWVEIMGPSGIGKSTFLKNLIQDRETSALWVTKQEAIIEIIRARKLKEFNSLKEKLFYLYLKQDIIRYANPQIAYSLFNKNKIFYKNAHNYNHLIESFIKYTHENEMLSFKKMSDIESYKSVIDFLAIADYYKYSKLVLLDEAPYNRNPGLIGVDLSNEVELPAAVIYCYADADTVMQRIKERAKTGRLVIFHRGLNDEELYSFIVKKQQEALVKKNLLVRLNVPTIDVDLGGLLTASKIKEINHFLNKIAK